MFDNFNEKIIKMSGNYDKVLSRYLDNLIKYIKTKNKNLVWAIPIIKTIKSNTNLILLFFVVVCLYYSNYFIDLFQSFILFDSIIISIIVLKSSKNPFYSRRLAKNVISLFILATNVIGSLFSILLVILIYSGFNKFISKTIFKFVEIFINFISSTVPFISDLYPNIKLIDHNRPIESTELIQSDSDDSNNSDNSDNFNNSSDINDSDNSSVIKKKNVKSKNKKEYKLYKKLINEIKTDK